MKGIMTEIVHLFKIDFDNMENRHAESTEHIKTFLPVGTRTAYGVCVDWFSQREPEKLYTGWNHEVYPKYFLKTERT